MKTDSSIPHTRQLLHLWITVPAVSFVGIGLGLLLLSYNIPYAIWIGAAGCVAASFILFYQAYTKPRRDIVSLFVPLYAFLIFIVPNEFDSGPIMQVIFAATITVLAIRVEKKFNTPTTQEQTMKQLLNDYIGTIEPIFAKIDEETGHLIAQSLLTYRFGLYENANERINEALARLRSITAIPGAIEAALLILQERAADLAISRVTPSPHYTFSNADQEVLAIRLRPDQIDNPAALDLDNALVLLYAVGIETSPEDEQALEEHQRFIIQILESYKDRITEKAA
jgi:multidrug transporter EmrE-like cation transporter